MNAVLKRNGNQFAGPAIVYLNKMQAHEAVDYQGANPHFVYKMSTLTIPTSDVQFIRQGDMVIDPNNVDPKTSTLRAFKIISDPEPNTLSMSWQWVAERQTRGGA